MRKLTQLTLSFLIAISGVYSQGTTKYTISGYVKEDVSNELLPGVTIFIPSLNTGVITNGYGFYSMTLPEGTYELVYTSVGFDGIKTDIVLNKDVVLDQFLRPSVLTLDEVVVSAELQEKVSENSQMSSVRLSTKSVENIPALMGEKDVLKVLQLMPGVQSGSEGNSGLYVRGGGPDQNLLILDDAIVYNANHLFGFFSIFNGDALKSTELYKGGFPARFGGRLSSVIKMDMKDGNKEEMHGKVGIGLISSSLMLEGPINKGKTSFVVSARRTYFDAIAGIFNSSPDKGGYYFYDLNAKVNHEFDSKNKLYVSGYFGQDRFFARNKEEGFDAKLGWGNASSTIRWNHQFSKKVFTNTSLIFSRYLFDIREEEDDFELRFNSSIRDFGFKYDVDFFPSINHSIKFGVSSTNHRFIPSALVVREASVGPTDEEEKFNTLESAIYVEDDMRLFGKLNANIGLRFSHFIHENKTYSRPEPRISLAYMLPNDYAVKASFASMNQYVHLLSNSGIGLPTDLWVSSTDRVRPQSSRQVALGFAKDISNGISVSLEGYLKKSDDVIAYKEGASFLILDDPESSESVSWEDNITTGAADAMGLELFLEKKVGDFTGWFGYTLSKTELQFDELNFGRKFLARYDRRHDVSLVGIYHISDRLTISGTWIYGTGNNFSLPVRTHRTASDILGNFTVFNDRFEDIDERNNFRAEAYHRLDLSIRMTKEKKRGRRTWELSLYNAYSRKNPFFYYQLTDFDNNGTQRGTLNRVTLFPILPSFRYTFEF
ncbi:TonB-dependent receptor [Ekhidna sp.]